MNFLERISHRAWCPSFGMVVHVPSLTKLYEVKEMWLPVTGRCLLELSVRFRGCLVPHTVATYNDPFVLGSAFQVYVTY